MPAARIVPALDEVEDRQASLHLGAESLATQKLALEGREKVFGVFVESCG